MKISVSIVTSAVQEAVKNVVTVEEAPTVTVTAIDQFHCVSICCSAVFVYAVLNMPHKKGRVGVPDICLP